MRRWKAKRSTSREHQDNVGVQRRNGALWRRHMLPEPRLPKWHKIMECGPARCISGVSSMVGTEG